jgi:hypothetical protein
MCRSIRETIITLQQILSESQRNTKPTEASAVASDTENTKFLSQISRSPVNARSPCLVTLLHFGNCLPS